MWKKCMIVLELLNCKVVWSKATGQSLGISGYIESNTVKHEISVSEKFRNNGKYGVCSVAGKERRPKIIKRRPLFVKKED